MGSFDELRVNRTTTAQQVANGLSEMILRGELAPGAPLNESAIAAAMHISRNTVREAVRLLEHGGLVRHEMHHGAVVLEPSLDEVRELYRARLRLEVAAVQLPMSAETVAGVQQAFRDLEKAAAGGVAQEIVLSDLAFHASIIRSLESVRIDALFQQLATELRFYLMVISMSDREYENPETVIAEHQVIVDPISARDIGAASAAITTHIEENCQRVTAILGARTIT